MRPSCSGFGAPARNNLNRYQCFLCDAPRPGPKQRANGTQPLIAAVNGTKSETFSTLPLLAATPPSCFTSTFSPTSSAPTSNLVRPPPTVTSKGPVSALLLYLRTPLRSKPVSGPTRRQCRNTSLIRELGTIYSSTHLTFATARLRRDISSSEPEPSELSFSTCHTAATRTHSPQPTNLQPPQIVTQDVISVLLGMPP